MAARIISTAILIGSALGLMGVAPLAHSGEVTVEKACQLATDEFNSLNRSQSLLDGRAYRNGKAGGCINFKDETGGFRIDIPFAVEVCKTAGPSQASCSPAKYMMMIEMWWDERFSNWKKYWKPFECARAPGGHRCPPALPS